MVDPRAPYILAISFFFVWVIFAPAATHAFVVDDPGDAFDISTGDGVCATILGTCTLRAAIQEANATPGLDSISFSPGIATDASGFVRLTPASSYPVITERLLIDGGGAPGYVDTPIVQISGVNAGVGVDGITIAAAAADSEVFRIAIHGFSSDGIVAVGDRQHILGCDIGIRDGTLVDGNGGRGIVVTDGTDAFVAPFIVGSGWTGPGNVISGNGEEGIWIENSDRTHVAHNFVGTDRSGVLAGLGNVGVGIRVESGDANEIGARGIDDYGGNVISGNGSDGLQIGPDATRTTIFANHVGTDVAGLAALPNARSGIVIEGDDTRVGDLGEELAINVISGNTIHGIEVGVTFGGGDPQGVSIDYNIIGLDADEFGTLGNGNSGVRVGNAGPVLIRRNHIGGNLTGILMTGGGGSQILTNTIGGSAAEGNASTGISVSTSNVLIGLPSTDDRNTISANGGDGVRVTGLFNTNVAIRGNHILDNGESAIDLIGVNGPDGNDPLDVDIGPNGLQNGPEFNASVTDYNPSTGNITSRFRVDSSVAESAYPLTIDYYLADESGTGGRWIAEGSYPAVAAGGDWIEIISPGQVPIGLGARLLATATDANGDTSEFSAPVVLPEPGSVAMWVGIGVLFAARSRRHRA